MRILILNWRDIKNPLGGGAEIVTHEYAKAWVKAGHEVTLFTSSFAGAKNQEELDGVKIIRRGNKRLIHLMLFHLLVIWFYFRHFRGKVDLVIDQIHGIPFFTPLYVKEKKLAFIHEVAKEIWNYLYPFPINILGRFSEKIYFRFYKNTPFIAVSESTKKDLVALGIRDDKVKVIRNGINVKPVTELNEKEGKPTFIFVNRLTAAKGIEDALKAFALILQKLPDGQFWVLGRGDFKYTEKLKDLAHNLGIYEKVKFFGFVAEEEKLELLKKAHLLLNPSIREGWSLIVTEANALGTPVVAYNSAGLRDSVQQQKTGIICEKNTPQSLAENAVNLFEDRKLYEQLRKNAWEDSKTFDWEKSTKKSLALIESLW